MEEPKSKIIFSDTHLDELEVDEAVEFNNKPAYYFDTSLVPMNIAKEQLEYLDSNIVADKFYNNFNFSKLSQHFRELNVTLGVTSANKGEGKTLVAANMAVSLAQAYRQRTILVDLNFKNPQLHKVFGSSLDPGLAEAMQNRMLRVRPTMVDDLYLLSAGQCENYKPSIKDTLALREILFTLKNEFDFVIVDMSSVFPIEEFPIHFINEIDGLLTVVNTESTRQEHLRKIYNHIDENRFVGYIMNKYSD